MPTTVDDREEDLDDGSGSSQISTENNDDKSNRILDFSGGIPIKGNDFSWHDREPDEQDYSVSDEYSVEPAGVSKFNAPETSSDYILLGLTPQRSHGRVAPIEAFSNRSKFLGTLSAKPHLHEGGILVEPTTTRDTSRLDKEWTGGVTVPDVHSAIQLLGKFGRLNSDFRLGKSIEDPEAAYHDIASFKNKMQNHTITLLASDSLPKFDLDPSGYLPKLVSIHLGTDESPMAIAFHTPVSLINPALNDLLNLHPHTKTTHYAVGESRFYNKHTKEPVSIKDVNLNSSILKGLLSLNLAPFRKNNPHLESSHTFSVMYPSVTVQKMANPEQFKGYFHTDMPQEFMKGMSESSGQGERGFNRLVGVEQIPNVSSIKNLVKLVKARI